MVTAPAEPWGGLILERDRRQAMNKITKHSAREVTYRFYGPEFMPADEDEGAVRDAQWRRSERWRPLKSSEIDALNQQGNSCQDWSNVRVTERFNPKLVR